jgi:hypothetical protein
MVILKRKHEYFKNCHISILFSLQVIYVQLVHPYLAAWIHLNLNCTFFSPILYTKSFYIHTPNVNHAQAQFQIIPSVISSFLKLHCNNNLPTVYS